MNNDFFTIEFITIDPKEEELNDVKPISNNKNSRRNKKPFIREKYEKTEIIWHLSEDIGGKVFDGMDWRYQSSEQELNKELTAEKFVQKLNEKNLFDFAYLPKENDYLSIIMNYIDKEIKSKTRPYLGSYISFIFKGKWVTNNGYDHIHNNYKNLKRGVVK